VTIPDRPSNPVAADRRDVASPATDPLPLLLSQPKAIAFLGTSRSGWFRLRASDKRFPRPVDVPGCGLMWRRADLEKFVEHLRAGGY
jgi:predicted DNA-binding transcriptional regulator AlpA